MICYSSNYPNKFSSMDNIEKPARQAYIFSIAPAFPQGFGSGKKQRGK
jgi:hypothetical protein